ncbi:MAG: hypothetical protein ACLTZT_01815 [Butyricimonas faecalis]
MSQTESRKGKSAYFVPTISISLVLIVVGMLVFILLNARVVSDHVKRNIGFAVIVKDNTNEVEIKRVQKILDTPTLCLFFQVYYQRTGGEVFQERDG